MVHRLNLWCLLQRAASRDLQLLPTPIPGKIPLLDSANPGCLDSVVSGAPPCTADQDLQAVPEAIRDEYDAYDAYDLRSKVSGSFNLAPCHLTINFVVGDGNMLIPCGS